MGYEHLKNKYAIVGVGYTPQGKVPDRTAVSFHVEACLNGAADAGIDKNEIDGLLLYRHFEALAGDYDMTAFHVAEQLGIRPVALSQEYYCTRTWLMHAIGLLESGFCRYVAISYGDNARSGRRSFTKEIAEGKATDELAAYGDISTMAKYAMLASRAAYEYGTGEKIWREIAIAQRNWAQMNERAAMFGKPLTDSAYDASEFIVKPFRMLDATPTSDGGRAVIITSTERARTLGKPFAMITGLGGANQPVSPYRLRVCDSQSAAAIAGRQAFEMAGMRHDDIDALELYDCFTYTVEATLVDYGFVRPEEVSIWLTRKRIGPGGELPVNTSGGMLSEAYFMGLTPLSEAVEQLRGRCGARQLGDATRTREPRAIMVSDNGAVFQSHYAMILTRG